MLNYYTSRLVPYILLRIEMKWMQLMSTMLHSINSQIARILNLNIKKISRLFDNFIKRLGKTVRNSKNIYCLYQQNLAKKENYFY